MAGTGAKSIVLGKLFLSSLQFKKKFLIIPMQSKSSADQGKEQEKFPGLDSLVYKSGDEWLAFPDWALFYIELGAALSHYDHEGKSFVTAVTIPVRSFAASLISSGVIVPRINLLSAGNESHIAKIKSLSIDTPVLFRTGNRQYKGVYKGIICLDGKRYFSIRYNKTSERAIPIESANKIEILNKEEIFIPKVQSGKGLAPPSPLVEKLLDKASLHKFLMESRLECIILGQINTLQQELCDFTIGYKLDEEHVKDGNLQDLVRVKGTQFQPASMTHRTFVWASSSRYITQASSRLSNYVTVFDNALGFIKWRSYFRKSNWIVVLDRTDRNYELAIKDLNEEYVKYRIDQRSKISFPNPPAGIEIMFFEVNV